MKKKLMVLGAGIFQEPFIQRSKEMGYYTIVVSVNKNERGARVADRFYNVSTADLIKLMEIAGTEDVERVIAPASDFNARIAAAVNQALDLEGLDIASAETITDKSRFRGFQQEHGLNHPPFVKISGFEEAAEFIGTVKFPLIVKPCRASGSKGVKVLGNNSGLKEYMEKANDREEFILESFLEGKEYGCEVFLQEGNLVFSGLTEKFKNEHLVPLAHIFPSGIDRHIEEKILQEIGRFAGRSGYKSGPLNLDILYTGNGPVILDAGPRSGGNGLPEIMSIGAGVDLPGAVISGKFNKNPASELKNVPVCSFIFGAKREGILEQIIDPEDIVQRHGGSIRKKIVTVEPGEHVHSFTSGSRNTGYMIFTAENKTILAQIVQELKETDLFVVV